MEKRPDNRETHLGEDRSLYGCDILLVDDNERLRQMVTEILCREGFANVRTAADCRSCLESCRQQMPDLIILDVGLPDGDGFSLMNVLRRRSDVPVLFLSARDEDSDRLLGLGLGADDYITKPFLPRELVLRLIAILKRTYFSQRPEQGREEDSLRLGSREVRFSEGIVREILQQDGEEREGRIWRLTAKELQLLKKLAENRGRIVTFDALSQALWGDFYYGYENSLMVHVRRLREKVEEDPSAPRYLLTVRGLGYKLEKQAEDFS